MVLIPLLIALLYIFIMPLLNLLIVKVYDKYVTRYIKDHESEKLKEHYIKQKDIEKERLKGTTFVEKELELEKKQQEIELIERENKAKQQEVELIEKENKAKEEAVSLIERENKAKEDTIKLIERENLANEKNDYNKLSEHGKRLIDIDKLTRKSENTKKLQSVLTSIKASKNKT